MRGRPTLVLALTAPERRMLALGMAAGQLARASEVLAGGPLGMAGRRRRREKDRALVALEFMGSALGWLGWLT